MSAANFRFQFWIRHFSRTEHLDLATFQTKIRGRTVGIEFVARLDDAPVVLAQKFFHVAAQRHMTR